MSATRQTQSESSSNISTIFLFRVGPVASLMSWSISLWTFSCSRWNPEKSTSSGIPNKPYNKWSFNTVNRRLRISLIVIVHVLWKVKVCNYRPTRIPWNKTSFNPGTSIWTNLVKRTLDNATYEISSIRASWFWRRRFFIFFYVFQWFTPKAPWGRAILDLGATIWTNLIKDHQALLNT